MLRRRLASVLLASGVAAAVLAPLPAYAAPDVGDINDPPPASDASGHAGGGGVGAGATTVTVDTGGSTTAGVPFSTRTHVQVPRRCRYQAGRTGKEYYDLWGPFGSAYTSPSAPQYVAEGLHAGYAQYKDETTGRWYEPICAAGLPREQSRAYYESHPAVYVLPSDPPPPDDGGLDPAFLAEVAFEHMQLPTGTIRWNPSVEGSGATVVNMDTFVWVENAATQVQVTASVPGVSSTVTARMSAMRVAADGATTTTCPDVGTPYAPGMTTSSCSVTFHRSTADRPVKAGQQHPTTTLTATATWVATWTSSLDPTPRPLESQTLTTTAEVPVAEIQTIVTG